MWPRCSACSAKDGEIARQKETIEWLQAQLDAQNKRFLEIADPGANSRVVQADRRAAAPISAPQAPKAVDPLLPGTEPSPAPSWEVTDDE
jgi:hypothetical protein